MAIAARVEGIHLYQYTGYLSCLGRSRKRRKISEWAGQENADFRATDSGSAVRNVVLRIVGQSVARVDRATALKLGRNNR